MDETQKPLGYGPVAAIIVSIGTFFGSQIFAGISIVLVLMLMDWDQNRVDTWLESGVLPTAITIFLSAVVTIYLLRAFLEHRKTTFEQLGIIRPKLSIIWQTLAGFALYFVSFLIIASIAKELIPGLNLEQEQDLGFDISGEANIPILIFSLVVIPPIIEEIVMRGFLFTGLRSKWPFWLAAVVTSILFAVAHLPGGVGGPLWVGALDTFVLSMVLCFVREKTGSLWPCILIHALKNSLALIYLVYLR